MMKMKEEEEEEEEEKGDVTANLEHFVDIASTEHLMNTGELVRLVGWEIGSKNTVMRASPPQKLASGTR